jgi:hypothetical protein
MTSCVFRSPSGRYSMSLNWSSWALAGTARHSFIIRAPQYGYKTRANQYRLLTNPLYLNTQCSSSVTFSLRSLPSSVLMLAMSILKNGKVNFAYQTDSAADVGSIINSITSDVGSVASSITSVGQCFVQMDCQCMLMYMDLKLALLLVMRLAMSEVSSRP